MGMGGWDVLRKHNISCNSALPETYFKFANIHANGGSNRIKEVSTSIKGFSTIFPPSNIFKETVSVRADNLIFLNY